MLLKVTKNVDSHRVNPNYPTLVIEFEVPRDRNFRIRSLFAADWCPKTEEVIEVVDKMLDIDPDFGRKLAERIENKSKRLWRVLIEYAFSKHEVKPRIEKLRRSRDL